MFEAKTNSNKKKEQIASNTILPENKSFESHQLKYQIKLPQWLRDSLINSENKNNNDTKNSVLIAEAFKLAFKAHEGQLRASGEPYIIHPVAVADLLREIGASPSVIAAGLLHDVVEDTCIPLTEIENNFGLEVKILVEGVTKLGGIHFTK